MLDEFLKWLESEVAFVEWFNARGDIDTDIGWKPEDEPDFPGYPSDTGRRTFGLEHDGWNIENLRKIVNSIKALQAEEVGS